MVGVKFFDSFERGKLKSLQDFKISRYFKDFFYDNFE